MAERHVPAIKASSAAIGPTASSHAARTPASLLREGARALLPPILLNGIKRMARRGRLEAPEWEYVPSGWAAASAGLRGWNSRSVLERQIAGWDRFAQALQGTGPLGISHEAGAVASGDYAAHNTLISYGYVLALAAGGREQLSVLDWGGGIGHYYLISRALLPCVQLDYHCKDVPLLCEGGARLLPDVTFHPDAESCFARRYDLVLSSSSLQYSEDWPGVVRKLAGAAGRYLFVTRLPVVHRAASFVVIQRPYRYGYGTEYAGWFLNRRELLDAVESAGLQLVREFLIQENPYVPGAPEQAEYRGFLFRATAWSRDARDSV